VEAARGLLRGVELVEDQGWDGKESWTGRRLFEASRFDRPIATRTKAD
jgi:hypothetical protein